MCNTFGFFIVRTNSNQVHVVMWPKKRVHVAQSREFTMIDPHLNQKLIVKIALAVLIVQAEEVPVHHPDDSVLVFV